MFGGLGAEGKLNTGFSENFGEKKLPAENSPEFMRVVRFQNNILELIVDQKIDSLIKAGELKEEGIKEMNVDQKSQYAQEEIMSFGKKYGAVYKILIKTNPDLFSRIYELEKDNPGGKPVSGSSGEKMAEYNLAKIKYETTKDERRKLAQEIFSDLNSEEKQFLNNVMVCLMVDKKAEKGGMTMDEFIQYVQPKFEDLYSSRDPNLLEAGNDSQKVQNMFQKEIETVKQKRIDAKKETVN
jgi:hypothetical protein